VLRSRRFPTFRQVYEHKCTKHEQKSGTSLGWQPIGIKIVAMGSKILPWNATSCIVIGQRPKKSGVLTHRRSPSFNAGTLYFERGAGRAPQQYWPKFGPGPRKCLSMIQFGASDLQAFPSDSVAFTIQYALNLWHSLCSIRMCFFDQTRWACGFWRWGNVTE